MPGLGPRRPYVKEGALCHMPRKVPSAPAVPSSAASASQPPARAPPTIYQPAVFCSGGRDVQATACGQLASPAEVKISKANLRCVLLCCCEVSFLRDVSWVPCDTCALKDTRVSRATGLAHDSFSTTRGGPQFKVPWVSCLCNRFCNRMLQHNRHSRRHRRHCRRQAGHTWQSCRQVPHGRPQAPNTTWPVSRVGSADIVSRRRRGRTTHGEA